MHRECHRCAFHVQRNAMNLSHFQSKHARTHPHTHSKWVFLFFCHQKSALIKRESRTVDVLRNFTGLLVKSEYTCSLMIKKHIIIIPTQKKISNEIATRDTIELQLITFD